MSFSSSTTSVGFSVAPRRCSWFRSKRYWSSANATHGQCLLAMSRSFWKRRSVGSTLRHENSLQHLANVLRSMLPRSGAGPPSSKYTRSRSVRKEKEGKRAGLPFALSSSISPPPPTADARLTARGRPDGGGEVSDAAPSAMLSRCSRTSERDHLARVRLDLGAVRGPGVHQLAALVEQVAAPIRGLDRVWDGVRQRHLGDFVRIARALGSPVAERTAEAMHGGAVAGELVQELEGHVLADRFAGVRSGEHVVGQPDCLHVLEHGNRGGAQRHAVVLRALLHPLLRDRPHPVIEVDLVPGR